MVNNSFNSNQMEFTTKYLCDFWRLAKAEIDLPGIIFKCLIELRIRMSWMNDCMNEWKRERLIPFATF